MASPAATLQDGVQVLDPSQLSPELRKRVDDHFNELEVKVGLNKATAGESKDKLNIPAPDGIDDENEQLKAAKRFQFADAVMASTRRDHAALEKMGVKAGGEATGAAGGYLVPEFYLTDRWIDVFRPAAIFRQLGPTQLTMPSHIEHVAQLTADVTVSWAGENSTLTDAEPSFGQVTFTAKKQYGFVIVSNELLQESNPAVDLIIRKSLAKKFAIDETQQCLLGTVGGINPVGIVNTTGVNSVAVDASPTFDNFIDAIYDLEAANVPPDFGIAWHPRTKASLRKLKDNYGRYLWDIDEPKAGSPGTIEGYTFAQTTLFPINQGDSSNESEAVVGNFEYGWLMERMDMDWLTSDVAGTAFASDQTWIRVTRRWDFQVAMPTAFALMTGIQQ